MVTHVPHASVFIPETCRADFLLTDDELAYQARRSADLFCDELFDIKTGRRVAAGQSRLVCDVERFRDDRLERSALKGNGLYYINTLLGAPLRPDDPVLRDKILTQFYDPHHTRLTAAVDCALAENDVCLILDGHSFTEEMAIYERQFEEMALTERFVGGVRIADGLPDFCIGADDFHTPGFLVDAAHAILRGLGYSVETNRPFTGSIVPMKHYGKDKRVYSLMIEVNKRLYLKDYGFEKSEGFGRVRRACAGTAEGLLKAIEQYQ